MFFDYNEVAKYPEIFELFRYHISILKGLNDYQMVNELVSALPFELQIFFNQHHEVINLNENSDPINSINKLLCELKESDNHHKSLLNILDYLFTKGNYCAFKIISSYIVEIEVVEIEKAIDELYSKYPNQCFIFLSDYYTSIGEAHKSLKYLEKIEKNTYILEYFFSKINANIQLGNLTEALSILDHAMSIECMKNEKFLINLMVKCRFMNLEIDSALEFATNSIKVIFEFIIFRKILLMKKLQN